MDGKVTSEVVETTEESSFGEGQAVRAALSQNQKRGIFAALMSLKMSLKVFEKLD